MENNNVSESLSTPVRTLVQKVLDTNFSSQSYPENITDLVCLAIENNSVWLSEYKNIVSEHSEWAVNSQIGRSTLQLTGLKNLGVQATATSKLIKTFTKLG